MCYTIWQPAQTGRFSKAPRMDCEFHYCIGLDVGCPATVAAYLSKYISLRESEVHLCSTPTLFVLLTFFSSKMGKAMRASKSIFCSYDMFHGYDVRVEIIFPGSIRRYDSICTSTPPISISHTSKSYIVDPSGEQHRLDDTDWHPTRVSAISRGLACLEADMDSNAQELEGAVILDALEAPATRRSLLKSLKKVCACLVFEAV